MVSFAILFVLGLSLSYFIVAPAFDEFGVIRTIFSLFVSIFCFGMCHVSLKMVDFKRKPKNQLEFDFKCKR
jgi:hypothetical protein